MTSPRSNAHYVRLFDHQEKKSADKKDKERQPGEMIKYDFCLSIKTDTGPEAGCTNSFSSRMFDVGSFRQPPTDFCFCHSKIKFIDFCCDSNIEPYGYTRKWRRRALDIAEFPLSVTNECTFRFCHHQEETQGCAKVSKYGADCFCCCCVCCTVRAPTYIVKSICCCIAGVAGKIADTVYPQNEAKGPDTQSMHNLHELLCSTSLVVEFKQNKKILEYTYDEKRRDRNNLFPNTYSQDAKPESKRIIDVNYVVIYDQEILKMFQRILCDKNYRDDIISPYGPMRRIFSGDIIRAVLTYSGKFTLTAQERIQILAYISERGAKFHETLTPMDSNSLVFSTHELFQSVIGMDIPESHQVLDFILSKIPKRVFNEFRDMIISGSWLNTLLKEFSLVNSHRGRLKSSVLQKYNIITPYINELVAEHHKWLKQKTAFEMGKHFYYGKNSRLFKLPKVLFVKILEFHDGIVRIKPQR